MTPTPTSVADALLQARRQPQPADAHTWQGDLPDSAAAYAVQDRVAQALGWFAGQAPGHWKSGGPGRDQALTHAPLPPAGIWASPATAGGWPFRQRRVESEIALRLARPVDAALAARLDLDSACELVDAMAPAIELVDVRWLQAFDAPPLLRLADQASHAALVLGEWRPFERRDWSAQALLLRIGAQRFQARGSHSCGDPAWVLAGWLRHASARFGTVPAGTVVTTGTWAGAPEAQAGDAVQLEFDGIGRVSVQL